MLIPPEPSQLAGSEPPRFAPSVAEDLSCGGRRLRTAFLETPVRFTGRDGRLLRAGMSEPAAILIRTGFAYRACTMPDRRRAILRILLPGDFAGLHNIVLARAIDDVFAASRVGYHLLGAAELRNLLADPGVSTFLLAQAAEAHLRADRLAASIGRLDARARLCVLLLDIHDRLRRRELITRGTFNLPLTQEQIADHLGLTLVHVNRTLRRLREEGIVLVDRQVVVIRDIARLQKLAQGLPQSAELPEAPATPERAVERTMLPQFGN